MIIKTTKVKASKHWLHDERQAVVLSIDETIDALAKITEELRILRQMVRILPELELEKQREKLHDFVE